MKILVIDAQGGGLGKQLIAAIKEKMPNAAATAAMLKAGAD